MDYPILELFTSLVISTTAIDNHPTTHGASCELSESDIIFGMNDGLLEIIKRISSLHHRSRTGKVNNSTTITEAVGIWQDLATWQPPESLPGEQYQELYDSYTSALFTWLYLILHPDSMCDEKVQSMVEQGVVAMSAVTVLELSPFLLIPLFILGLASVQDEHKDFISGLLDHIEEHTACEEVEVYRTMVERSWESQDQGMPRSWEWIQWQDAGPAG
ncbi:hypothetical protein ANOM_006715 [Aspergillus nomiae NRRL 13137]|uniref:C6 transcription factor n=1 Tax=Aspergillus nomiae NRRL (strain ATCC 15546 / NRRL 13137 / CBS 260.88 / M93) TaxID=1509407 RepID=A0A0L1IZF5_ASPN3|nr:uncharacterized protein ANOM_006715 [Aspergillus nomiae NRRL 13137]KNG84800.1 hypothetical protein ANOM_006715 [Aspergillus nomiae NRRL 13137]